MRKSDLVWAVAIIMVIIFCLIATVVMCIDTILDSNSHLALKIVSTAWIFIFGYTVGVVVRGKENK